MGKTGREDTVTGKGWKSRGGEMCLTDLLKTLEGEEFILTVPVGKGKKDEGEE